MHRVETPEDIHVVADLAGEIWRDHYAPIIGLTQTDYMLATFQSAPAISRQIAEGYQYYLTMAGDVPAGYVAFVRNDAGGTALLSKLYVRRSHRRRGLARTMVAFVEDLCRAAGVRELWLTVNRHNTGSIAFYQQAGFVITGTLITDIGHGFVMDDFRMAKPIRQS